MKAVIFGEYKVERMVEPLLARGCAEVVVYTEEELDDVVPPGVTQRRLDLRATAGSVLRALRREAPDVATTSVYALGQEHLLAVYAEAARSWDGRFVVHPTDFATLACDKAALYATALARGWPVPAGAVCHRPADVRAAAAELGLPVMVKEGRTQAGEGVHRVGSPARLAEVVDRIAAYPVVVTEVCDGIEVGVELVTGERGSARWPTESAGPLDEHCAPLRRPRVSPFALPAAAAAELDDLVADLTVTFRPWGGWQLDLAVVDGHLRLLEINGRLGGLSELGLAATGVDPHAVVISECLGAGLPDVAPLRVGLELTGTAGAEPAPLSPGMTLTEITWNATHRSLRGTDLAQYIVGVPRHVDGERWVRTMAGRGLRVPVDGALAQLERGFATLAARDVRDRTAEATADGPAARPVVPAGVR